MSNITSSRLPRYRKHKPSDQAVVTLAGRDYYLGPFGTTGSKASYDRLIGEWVSRGRQPLHSEHALTVSALILAYWRSVGSEIKGGRGYCVKQATGLWRRTYGEILAIDFGPKALKQLRLNFIAQGWSRSYVNAQVDRIRHAVAWAVSEELLPGSQAHALREVKGLRFGENGVREAPTGATRAARACRCGATASAGRRGHNGTSAAVKWMPPG